MVTDPVPDAAVCLDCGYSLRGLPTPVCPECGREFDPADPATFRDTSRRRSFWFTDMRSPQFLSHFASPPPMWQIVAAMLITAAILNTASIPFYRLPLDVTAWLGLLGSCACIPVIAVLLASYVVRLIARKRLDLRTHRTAGDPHRRRRWRWYVLPLCTICAVSSFAYPWPLVIRFALGRPAFERAAQRQLARAPTSTGPQWIGLYKVESITVESGQVSFCVGSGLIDAVYFVYDPAPTVSGTLFKPVPGQTHWYMFKD